MKEFKKTSRFQQASFRVNVHDATTELPDSIQNLSNTTDLINTYVTEILALPAFINSSATQSRWAAIFPQKATTTVCVGFCINPSTMVPDENMRRLTLPGSSFPIKR